MARWAPQKRDTLRETAGEMLQHYGRGRVIVAVTGGPGPGLRAFADDLAEVLRDDARTVAVASIEDFSRTRADLAERRITTPARLWSGRLDEVAFRRALVDPFRMAGSAGFQTAVYDPARNVMAESEWTTAGPDAVLIVAGRFLLRPALRGIWNFSIWVDLPVAAAAGTEPDAEWAAALADGDQRGAASALIDGADPEHPRRVFVDSC